MIRMTGVYRGNKRIELTHEPSGATLLTDAPKDNQGEGSSFSPTDLAAASLASCVITTMAIYAESHSVDMSGAWVEVEKHMQSSPRKLARVPITVHLPPGLSAKEKSALEKAGSHCPVHRSLDESVEVNLRFLYDVSEESSL